MVNIFDDNSHSIGNTPLVRLNRITKGMPGMVAVKIEGRNPANSVKCRIGASMIWEAERLGKLKPGSKKVTVIEPTSGNTGIALAFVCASRGYPLTLAMPETMSIERRKMLAAFGANLVLTEGSKGMKGAIEKAEEIVSSDPAGFYMPQQFKNPANPQIHFRTTGPEIWEDTNGKIDIVVAGVGTGGTITGITKYLKNVSDRHIWSVAVEPAASPVLTQIRNGQTPQPGPHKIQGIGAGFKPDVLDLNVVDEIATVSNDEAMEYSRRLHLEEGITAGISSGAAVAVAVRLAQCKETFVERRRYERNSPVASKPVQGKENFGKLIVAILPDSGERYLSTELFENLKG